MDKDNIQLIINACKENRRAAQKKLYQLYFSYGMSVALRYASNREEAEEILNESFYKVFKRIAQYDKKYEFKKWFRQILINTSIDYFRKYNKIKQLVSLELEDRYTQDAHHSGIHNLLYEDLLKLIQQLPPSYRLVFNMYALEGYKHHEIADKLNISIGSSKSNYSKARKLLRKIIDEGHVKKNKTHVR